MEIIDRFTLPVLYQSTPSEIINARVIVGAGSQNEEKHQYGVAHFLEHMFFKGTEKRSYKEINALAGRLGHINAYTGFDKTVFHLTYLADDFEEGLRLLLEMVFYPAFPPDELNKEIGVITEELKSQSASPVAFFRHAMFGRLLGGDEWHNILGSEDDLRSMNTDRLHSFRSRWYARNRIAISVVGNVSPSRLCNAMEGYLPKYKGVTPDADNPWLLLRDCEFHHPSKQAIIALVAPGVNTNAEFESGQVPDVLANAMGGGMHSLLFDRIREELGLCYHISASHFSYASLGVFEIFSMLDQSNIPTVVEESKKIIGRICREGIPPELLDTAKRNHLFTWARTLERSSGIGGCNDMFFNVSPDACCAASSYADRKRRLAAITNQHIIEFARKTFGENGDKLQLIAMTPE